ncbi:MAG: 16S rRNA (guanine(966)-N(2))-methyltransferase RsmD [Rhodoferax sp.]|nr:16S rRNA (guanine(966)-N(2))-methyltransferase RsmD [Rhodoferax sp.]
MNAKATSSRSATAAPKRTPRPRAAQSHEIRIIGGLWKRTKLKVADKPGLRPTPDRVRETVFNWLGQDMTGLRCLDAFAGTGALGFEAASRGAHEVRIVEQDGALIEQLKKTQAQLEAAAVQVQRGDGVVAIRQAAPGSVDVVFIDPPFDAPLFEPALQACARALAPKGWVYLEAPMAYTDDMLRGVGLCVHRHLKAGAVHAHLLMHSAA